MKEADNCFKSTELKAAIDCFMTIHNKMWEINSLCSGEDVSKLKDRQTRLEIIDILRECEKLEETACKCIDFAIKSYSNHSI